MNDIAEHICQVKISSDVHFFWKHANENFFLSAPSDYMVNDNSYDDQNVTKNSPVICDGYVKYQEAEVDGLVAILKTNNCGGGGGEGCLIKYCSLALRGTVLIISPFSGGSTDSV